MFGWTISVRTGAGNATPEIYIGFRCLVDKYLKEIHRTNDFKNYEFQIKSKYVYSMLIKLKMIRQFINTRIKC